MFSKTPGLKHPRTLTVLLVLFVLTNLQPSVFSQSSLCVFHETCGKCLSADISCSWCIDRTYDMNKPRCLPETELKNANCKDIYVNKLRPVEIVEDEMHHDFTKDNIKAIQIKPQKVSMSLRKYQTQSATLTFRLAKNYPLDLYYLMDLTWSMRDDKETLVNVGKDLANTLQNLTENYRLGFGSFVDKPSMPFMPIGKESENPCALEQGVCEKTYGFRHRLTLTNNITEFISKVNLTDISGNLDNLEGGFDALMQILVCTENIGWHDQSRKIVILATDGLMHFAGDGLLAGVVNKNDKKCHLDDSGEYLGSLIYDYPSLEEIYREMLARKTNVIFAVTQNVNHIYNQIYMLMQGVSYVGTLKMDSSNILDLVARGFYDFVGKIQFSDNAPANIEVKYYTTCGGLHAELKELSKCENVEIDKDFEIFVNVTLLDYPKDGSMKHTIRIEESSLVSESLEIEIEMVNECPCLMDEVGEMNSTLCNNNGEMKCGMCLCDSGWSGKKCECDLLNYGNSKELEHQCRAPVTDLAEGNKMGKICDDHGECLCGQCYCNYGYSGKYCNCIDDCPYFAGKKCGGKDRGECGCAGECLCRPGWSGERCDCSTSNVTCTAPNDDQICSGHGQCNCGQCKCDSNFYGNFCETTPSGNSSLCVYYESCVQCLLTQKFGKECSDMHYRCTGRDGSDFQFVFVNDLSDTNVRCMLRTTNDDLTCDQYFTYSIDKQQLSHLNILNNDCKPINLGMTFFVAIIATVLVGLLVILLVKLNNVIQDRREFAKFEEERRFNTKYDNKNPLYNSPFRQYEVPKSLAENYEPQFEMKTMN